MSLIDPTKTLEAPTSLALAPHIVICPQFHVQIGMSEVKSFFSGSAIPASVRAFTNADHITMGYCDGPTITRSSIFPQIDVRKIARHSEHQVGSLKTSCGTPPTVSTDCSIRLEVRREGE